jgi:hypothetical protein
LQSLLESAEKPLTRRDIFRAWPDSAAAPSKMTLWKWLSECVKDGKVLQHGHGNRKEPYTYHLPGMVEKWQADLMANIVRRVESMPEKPTPSSPR